jgi:hypothetical protein
MLKTSVMIGLRVVPMGRPPAAVTMGALPEGMPPGAGAP